MDQSEFGLEPTLEDPIGTASPTLQRILAQLRLKPEVAEYYYHAGVEYRSLGRADWAKRHFEQAVRLKADFDLAHIALADLLLLSGQLQQAKRHTEIACAISPSNKDWETALAGVFEAGREYDRADEIIDRLLAAGYRSPQLVLLAAQVAPRRKAVPVALELIEDALRRAGELSSWDRSSLHFAAANLLDHLGRYDEAFQHAARANSLRQVSYDSPLVERLTGQFIEFFTRDRLRKLSRSSQSSQAPVFIVGMARSGTSLIEQLLASHRQIGGVGERDWVFRLWEAAVRRHSIPMAPLYHCLERMSVNDANELAEKYHAYLRWIIPTADRVTDKTPTNFLHLGLISMLFPQSHIIYSRRDPRDTCLSCYMTGFSTGNNFSFDLAWAGHFQKQTDRLMDHWKKVLDVPILDVEYEQVVGDVEGQARRMLDFLGMPWDDGCLKFHENRRYVSTASSSQVRRPIYQNSIGRWRHYEKHLGPLLEALA